MESVSVSGELSLFAIRSESSTVHAGSRQGNLLNTSQCSRFVGCLSLRILTQPPVQDSSKKCFCSLFIWKEKHLGTSNLEPYSFLAVGGGGDVFFFFF